MTANTTGWCVAVRYACLLGPDCGLCQIRGERAAAERAVYTALQRRIAKALATTTARNAQRRRTPLF